ncbi:MAG: hypothetical protein F7C81_02975 [Desulfurococcales archaeon]|nr:hypothetical protein [Desulfurococcales archaeon]
MELNVEKLLVGRIEPQILGPRPYKLVKKLAKPLSITGLSITAFSIPILFMNKALSSLLLITGITLTILIPITVRLWRSILASGIEQELPALLSYILPYSHTPRHIADLVMELPKDIFKWTRNESERLKILLEEGHDPLSALRILAETTPSRRLREVILDYATAQSLGAPRSQTTLLLLNHAITMVRMKWKSHVEAGSIVAELTATAIIAGSAMTPITMLAGGNAALVSIFSILTPLIGGLGLLLTRPVIGDIKPSPRIYIPLLILPLIISVLLLNEIIIPSLAILAIAALASETLTHKYRRTFEEGMRALRAASERSRYGMDFEETLRKAENAASGVVKAIIQSATIAGRLGVGEAISRLYQVVEEAVNSVKTAKVQALLMMAISVAAPPIALYAIKFIENAASTAADLLVDTSSVNLIKGILTASAVLAPLPAAIVHRGWLPSLLPSLASLLASLYVIGAL